VQADPKLVVASEIAMVPIYRDPPRTATPRNSAGIPCRGKASEASAIPVAAAAFTAASRVEWTIREGESDLRGTVLPISADRM